MEASEHQNTSPQQSEEEQPIQSSIASQISLPFTSLQQYWNRYFVSIPPTSFNMNLPLHKVIYCFFQASQQPFFENLFKIDNYSRQHYEVSLNYTTINPILDKCPPSELVERVKDVMNSFQYEAGMMIQAMSLVLHYYLVDVKQKKSKKVCLMIENYPQMEMKDIKAHMIENFITIQAAILKVYQLKLMPISVDFTCLECKGTFTHMLTDGNFSTPNKCKIKGRRDCKSKSFQIKKESMKNIFIQRIKVQQIDAVGRTPRQIFCEMRQNLVGKVITGQTIKLSGIIKTETLDEKDKKTQGIFVPYLLVNSIYQAPSNNTWKNDTELINSMKSDENIFYSVIKSFCPAIYGNQLVKAGLLLAIVGGSSKNLQDQSTFRQTSHILLLGDPGIGKSQLLKFAVEILPHSVYINATVASNSGLTVAVNKDNNEQCLEAGALILADNGICAIDEFDKASDHSSLLQVMEQQTVSITKAGIICQLKCRVGIVASANPTYGCYNKSKSFRENTKISNAILSRFDLIFLLVDKPDAERDKKLSEHIMKIHNNRKKKKNFDEDYKPQSIYSKYEEFLSLTDKYSKICGSLQTTYSLDQLRKYLTYVKTQIHPTLTRGACQILKGFYLALRQNNPTNNFQITNRHLESLVRLSMAKARIEGRNEVRQEDAQQITQLMQESLFDSFQEMGYNINSLNYEVKKAKIFKKNSALSLPKQKALFIDTLRNLSEQKQNNIFEWGELVKACKDLDLQIGDFYAFIERLNQDGMLLQKGNKRYALQNTFV